MLQVIRAIAWLAISIGVAAVDSEEIFIPAAIVFVGFVLLKFTEFYEGVDE